MENVQSPGRSEREPGTWIGTSVRNNAGPQWYKSRCITRVAIYWCTSQSAPSPNYSICGSSLGFPSCRNRTEWQLHFLVISRSIIVFLSAVASDRFKPNFDEDRTIYCFWFPLSTHPNVMLPCFLQLPFIALDFALLIRNIRIGRLGIADVHLNCEYCIYYSAHLVDRTACCHCACRDMDTYVAHSL